MKEQAAAKAALVEKHPSAKKPEPDVMESSMLSSSISALGRSN